MKILEEIENMCAGVVHHFSIGYPTAISGREYGLERRFKSLLNATSIEGKAVLEVGCGFGAHGKIALEKGANLSIGLDLEKDYLLKARKIERVRSDAHTLPFKDSSFDVLLLIEILEHLPHQAGALQEIKRVSKKGSIVFITVPNKFYPFETHGFHGFKVDRINPRLGGIPFLSWAPQIIRNRVERTRVYTSKSLVRLLNNTGFQVCAVDYMMPPLDRVKNSKLVKSLRKILSRLEETFFKYFAVSIIVIASPN